MESYLVFVDNCKDGLNDVVVCVVYQRPVIFVDLLTLSYRFRLFQEL